MKIEKINLCFSAVVSIIFTLLFLQNVCPYTLSGGGDSVIFQQMGQAMLLGKVPYLDLFDHKGFLLYCIQALALLIHKGHWGFYILTVIGLTSTLYLWNKISGLLISGWRRYIPSVLTLALYITLCNKGNDTEFWSLPFISYSIYLLCRHYKMGDCLSYIECFLLGVCVGVIAFIRLNNVAPICVVCLALAVSYIIKKRYARLGYSILSVIGGFLSAILATILLFTMLYGVDNLNYLIFGTFTFNLEYMSSYKAMDGSILQIPFYLSIVMCLVCAFLSDKKSAVIFLILAFVFTYLTFGKSYYNHYFTITLPLYIVGFTLLLDTSIARKMRITPARVIVAVCIMVAGCVIVWPSISPRIERGRIMERGLSEIQSTLNSIPSSELDSIWNYNAAMTGANILQTINRVQMNRIFLGFQLGLSPDLVEVGNIEDVKPLWIMINDKTRWKEENRADSAYVANNYREEFRSDFETAYIKNVIFYRRK